MSRPPKHPSIDRIALIDEAVSSLTQRKLRSALTCLGTVLGVGVLISVLGLTASAASQIDKRFTERTATSISVQQTDSLSRNDFAFPRDFEQRISRIRGVTGVGLTWKLDQSEAKLRASPVPGTDQSDSSDVQIYATTPGALRIANPRIRTGRLFDSFAESAHSAVAVLGPTAASSLGISDLSGRPVISIGGNPFTVIGVLSDVEAHPELLHAIMIPTGTALSIWGEPTSDAEPTGWIQVERGAGGIVADQIPVAINAAQPDRFDVQAPPSARVLQGAVSGDIQGLLVILAAICLIVGMVGIANTTFVTVMERTGEIGLRRSLGAKRAHIAAQFLVEAAVLGLIGGLLGTFLGTGAIVAVCVANAWTAVLPAGLTLIGPGLGLATALLAAVYPALRGAWVDPIVALRGGTQS